MTILRTNTIAGVGTTTFGPTLSGNLEFNSQNYVVLPKGTSTQEGVLRTTADVVGTGGTFYDNLVLAMPFNAATGLTDVSSRNRNPAAYGNVAISTAQSKYYGSSAYFDGTGDYLVTNLSIDTSFVQGDFTFEGWIFPTATTEGGVFGLIGNQYFGVRIDATVIGNDAFYFSTGPSPSINTTITRGTWNHIAMVKRGTTGYGFVNGVSVGTTSVTSPSVTTSNLHIGIYYNTSYSFTGYLQDLRIYKGLAKYTANFTPPERIAEVGVGFKAGQLRYNTDSNKVELYDGSQWAEVQASRPDLNGGARGVFGGGTQPGNTTVNIIDYVTISTTGNAIDFGDNTQARTQSSSCSSSTRGIFAGGITIPTTVNIIDYITISSTGNALDFGDLYLNRRAMANGSSSSTRGLFAGGYDPNTNVIDYITISSLGNSIDFGDLTGARYAPSSCSSPTRAVFIGGGVIPPNTAHPNIIDFVTISTLGNAQDFGDIGAASNDGGACSNSTRGVYGGGDNTPTNIIYYITISTLGNAQKFGDLSVARTGSRAASSSTRGLFGGGNVGALTNIVDYVNINVMSNTVDFGDLTVARSQLSAFSNAHGGL